jgi:hypothetical protein
MTDTAKRIEALAPWAAGLLLATPVLVAYYPPMTDLPYHEAAVGILRHLGDASMFPPGLYHYNLGQPNQLFHLVAWALSYLVSTRWAMKLVVAAAVVSVPVCGARFARHLGASPLGALVVAPMALGWLFSWGLVANIVGLAALLATLPWLDRLANEPTPRRAALAAAGAAVLYLAHEAMMVVYAGATIGLLVLYARRDAMRKTALRAVPFGASAALAAAQAQLQKRVITPAVRGMPTFWHPVLHKLKRVPYIILPATDNLVQISMFALCVLVVVAFLWLRRRERRAAGPSAEHGWRAWAIRHRWELFAAACFGAYLAFPLTLSGATLVYQRFFPPAFAVFVIASTPRDLWVRQGRIARMTVGVLPLATLLVAWAPFADSSREYVALEKLLPHVEPGSAVAEIDLGPGDPSRTYSLGPASGRILATRGGRLSYAFTDSSVSPVVMARKYQWNESLIRIGFDSWAFEPAVDFKRFRYALVRTTDPELAEIATYALSEEARPVDTAGEWILFESKLDVMPPASHDFPPPKPPPQTVRERINDLLATLRNAPGVTVPDEPTPDPAGASGRQY